MEQKAEHSHSEHHHHHHHRHDHSIKTGNEKVTWKDFFSESKYTDPTSQMRFHMEKHRRLKDAKRRFIFMVALGVACIVGLCVFYAYFIDK